MKKKILGLLTATMMVSSMPAMPAGAAGSSSFTDVDSGDYYAQAAAALSERDILTGYEDGSFGAYRNITRAEMAAVICRMLDKEEAAGAAAGATDFYDVAEGHWASGYINVAAENGIINGDGDGRFRPEDNVKYEEAIKMVVCALDMGDNVVSDPSDWSAGYIAIADANNITNDLRGSKGYASTRGDVAVMVYNGIIAGGGAYGSAESYIEALNSNNESCFVSHNESTGAVQSINGRIGNTRISSNETAVDAIGEVRTYLGIAEPEEELSPAVVNDDEYGTCYTFDQQYNDIKVYGRTVTVSAKTDGESSSLYSGALPTAKLENVNTAPAISQSAAEEAAKAAEGGGELMVASDELVIYSLDEYKDAPVCAYAVNVVSSEESGGGVNSTYIVNAQNGEVIAGGSNISDAAETGSGKTEAMRSKGTGSVSFPVVRNEDGSYIMKDTGRGITMYYQEEVGQSIIEVKSQNEISWDATAVSAYTNLIKAYDWYNDMLGRKSVDGKGMMIHSIVHAQYEENGKKMTDNATWNGTLTQGYIPQTAGYISFYDNEGGTTPTTASSFDSTVHEFTHGVNQFMTKSGFDHNHGNGHISYAIDEAYSDIMGWLAEVREEDKAHPEKWDPEIGTGWKIIRNVKEPEKCSNPSKVEGNYWYYKTQNKDAYAHTNSTVISHAAYLMSVGYPNEGLNGIPYNMLLNLWYNSLSKGYDSQSDFATVRQNVLKAADSIKLSSDLKPTIKKAFDDVGIYEESSSETEMKKLLKKSTPGTVAKTYYGDFDKDGKYEMFAFVGDSNWEGWVMGELWVVSGKKATKVASSYYSYFITTKNDAPEIIGFDNNTMFICYSVMVEPNGRHSDYKTYFCPINQKEVYSLEGRCCPHDTEAEFYRYDIDSNKITEDKDIYYYDINTRTIKAVGAVGTPGDITVYLRGEKVDFGDNKPYIENGRTMVSADVLLSAMGFANGKATDTNSGKYVYVNGNQKIIIQLNSRSIEYYKNDRKTEYYSNVVSTKKEKVYVEARSIGHLLGCSVYWQERTQTVYLRQIYDFNKTDMSDRLFNGSDIWGWRHLNTKIKDYSWCIGRWESYYDDIDRIVVNITSANNQYMDFTFSYGSQSNVIKNAYIWGDTINGTYINTDGDTVNLKLKIKYGGDLEVTDEDRGLRSVDLIEVDS